MRVTCTVNGEPHQADDVWEGESLLYVLRERMGLPGSKNACEQGECGSCTVYLDGVPACACLVAAGKAEIWFEPKVEVWDLAPLKLILEEAGGLFFAFDGSRRIDRRTAIGCAPGVATQVREAFGVPPA